MIKLSFCLRRLPHLSRAQFQHYWRTIHAPLVASHAGTLKILRYVQSHTSSDADYGALGASRGSAGSEYDGVAELWWESKAALMSAFDTPAGLAASAALLADERNFIDLPNSPLFIVEEHEVVAPAPA